LDSSDGDLAAYDLAEEAGLINFVGAAAVLRQQISLR
jgi:hypothetical protein